MKPSLSILYCRTHFLMSAAEAEKKEAEKKHRYSRKPMHFRIACVLACAAVVLSTGEPDWAAANVKMRQWIVDNNAKPGAEHVEVLDHGYDYLKTYWKNFNTYGWVFDAPRDPKHHKIPQHAAIRAANLVKQGKWVTTRIKGKDYQYVSYFTSIEQACNEVEELEAIRVEYDATYDQLLTAMKAYDPTLQYRRIFFKHQLTPQQREERSNFAKAMLDKLAADASILPNTIYIDEASIVLSGRTRSDVHVWCDKYDMSFTDVCPVPLKPNEDITVRWICAVSAHPAFADKGGLVYFEFTTGTDDIKRKVNTKLDGNFVEHKFKYTVSLLHKPEPAVAILISVIPAIWLQQQQCLYMVHVVAAHVVQLSSI